MLVIIQFITSFVKRIVALSEGRPNGTPPMLIVIQLLNVRVACFFATPPYCGDCSKRLHFTPPSAY